MTPVKLSEGRRRVDLLATATVQISGIELLALKKLVLVNLALATKISGTAGEEQKALANILSEITLRVELEMNRPTAGRAALRGERDGGPSALTTPQGER